MGSPEDRAPSRGGSTWRVGRAGQEQGPCDEGSLGGRGERLPALCVDFSPPCSRGGWGNLNSTVSWHTRCCCASRCALAGHLFQSSITQLRKPALRPDRRCLFISAGLFSLSSWPQRWDIQHCPAGGTQGRFAVTAGSPPARGQLRTHGSSPKGPGAVATSQALGQK